ncbi:MAG TPA: hypothetical protein PKZ22_12940, partial [Accumulibacter sp.]|nr:hypothetical protein [Accumulibacter sp.]
FELSHRRSWGGGFEQPVNHFQAMMQPCLDLCALSLQMVCIMSLLVGTGERTFISRTLIASNG